jgi:hypothetical protein
MGRPEWEQKTKMRTREPASLGPKIRHCTAHVMASTEVEYREMKVAIPCMKRMNKVMPQINVCAVSPDSSNVNTL